MHEITAFTAQAFSRCDFSSFLCPRYLLFAISVHFCALATCCLPFQFISVPSLPAVCHFSSFLCPGYVGFAISVHFCALATCCLPFQFISVPWLRAVCHFSSFLCPGYVVFAISVHLCVLRGIYDFIYFVFTRMFRRVALWFSCTLRREYSGL